MNMRLAALAALSREVALPASVLTCIVASGLAGIDNTGAAPMTGSLAQSLTADTQFADEVQPTRSSATVVAATEPVSATPDMTPASAEPETATAALTDSALTDPWQTPAPPEAALKTESPETKIATAEPGDIAPSAVSTEAPDQCAVVDSCIDRYLWSLYQRAPKEDSVSVEQQRQVRVKKKGKLVTVTKTFTTSAAEDFSWKDPKAADKVGLPIQDYVIGGMDRDFRIRLFHLLQVADQEGLAPGITSAFRDDYRQSIATGLKAANDRSYHGGSSHGGYGHGLAADVVSVNGATRAERLVSTQTFWKWIDTHGQEFGIGRPYMDRDPPHVAPIDGKEYADHHPGMKSRQAQAQVTASPKSQPVASPKGKIAAGDDRNAAKHARAAKSPKVRTS
jgi:hypothetical protein